MGEFPLDKGESPPAVKEDYPQDKGEEVHMLVKGGPSLDKDVLSLDKDVLSLDKGEHSSLSRESPPGPGSQAPSRG